MKTKRFVFGKRVEWVLLFNSSASFLALDEGLVVHKEGDAMKKLMGLLCAMVILPTSLWAATVTGQVTRTGGGGGGALAGAKVVLVTTTVPAQRLDSTTTNAQGNYTLTNVAVGLRQVQVTLTGYQTGTGFVNVASATGTYTVNVALTATAGGGGTGTVAGLVTAAIGNAPVANALVVLTRFGGGGGVADSVRTNAQGLYTLDSVPAQTNYIMAVTATGYQTANRTGVTVTANQTTTENFSMAAPVSRTGTVIGTVTNATTNAPVANALVVLSRIGGGAGVLDSVRTNAQGLYTIDSVTAQANYTITVTATGYHTSTATGVTVTGGATTTENFALVPGTGGTTGTVNGTILGTANAPIANAQVILTSFGGAGGAVRDTVHTNAQGYYSFTAAAGNYSLAVTAAGYQAAVRNALAVTAGQTAVADFSLTSSTAVAPSLNLSSSWRTSWMEGRMALEFKSSQEIQKVEVFGLNGALLHRISVPAGVTSLLLPADITPASRAFVRVNGLIAK
jgi:hypothetical protein